MIKKKKKKTLNSGIVRMLMCGAIVYFVVGYISQEIAIIEYKRELKNVEAQILKQEEKLKRVQSMQSEYNSDEYIEKIAREKLGLVYSDEKVFVDISKK